jgi:hypothetical protein
MRSGESSDQAGRLSRSRNGCFGITGWDYLETLKPKEALKQSNPKRISDLMILGVKVDFLF